MIHVLVHWILTEVTPKHASDYRGHRIIEWYERIWPIGWTRQTPNNNNNNNKPENYLATKLCIKQFVVTNCSKERPGWIVTKTLKSGILIPIATSKESYFNADFKYISFTSSIKSYKPEKSCTILENREKHPLKVIEYSWKSHHQIKRIRKPYCRSFKLLSTKMWNFVFFARRQITDACLFVCLFFFVVSFPGVIVSTQLS